MRNVQHLTLCRDEPAEIHARSSYGGSQCLDAVAASPDAEHYVVRREDRIRAIEKVTILAVVEHLLGGIPGGITTVDVVDGRECISPA